MSAQPLSSYLSTPFPGAPSTTALGLISDLNPVAFNLLSDSVGTPPHYGFIPSQVQTAAETENLKLDSLLKPRQPPGASYELHAPIATSTPDLTTLALQGILELEGSVGSLTASQIAVSPAVDGQVNVQSALETLATVIPVFPIPASQVSLSPPYSGHADVQSAFGAIPTFPLSASSIVVSPTVVGQSNVQSALTSIAASVPSIPSGTGYVVESAPGTFINSHITNTGSGVTVTGGNGASGTTTVALSSVLEGLNTALVADAAGVLVSLGPSAGEVTRVIQGSAPIVVTNGSGAAGNPSISFNAAAASIPAANVTVSPTVLGQSNAQSALTSLAAAIPSIPSGTGYVVESSPGTFINSTINTSGTGVTVTGGNGASGTTTVSLSTGLQQMDTALASAAAGVLVTQGPGVGDLSRVIAGTSPIVVTNGSGVAGNPTVSLSNSALFPSGSGLLFNASGTLSNITVGLNLVITGGTTLNFSPAGTSAVVSLISGSLTHGVNTYSSAKDVLTWNGTSWDDSSNIAVPNLGSFPALVVRNNLFLGNNQTWASQGSSVVLSSSSWNGNQAFPKPLFLITQSTTTLADLQFACSEAITFQTTGTFSGFTLDSLFARAFSVQTLPANINSANTWDYSVGSLGNFIEAANIDVAGNSHFQTTYTNGFQVGNNAGSHHVAWDTWASSPISFGAVTNGSGTATLNLTSIPPSGIDITSGNPGNPPDCIQLTVLNPNPAISIVANVTSRNNSSIVIQTNQMPAGTPIAANVYVTLTCKFPRLS